MNVTNMELSKELSKLSGWNGCDFGYFKGTIIYASTPEYRSARDFPAYDLGYLLRKLHHKDFRVHLYHSQGIPANMVWWLKIDHHDTNEGNFTTEANTPEDAAAKLAIKLFEEGVLKK